MYASLMRSFNTIVRGIFGQKKDRKTVGRVASGDPLASYAGPLEQQASGGAAAPAPIIQNQTGVGLFNQRLPRKKNMADWYRCINKHNRPVLINLSMATSMIWTGTFTLITFAGGDEPTVYVKEEPEAILAEGPIES